MTEPIPAVCSLDDLARLLKLSTRTIKRRRRAGTFPIPELVGLGGRPRWSGRDVERFLESNQPVSHRQWRRA